MSIDTVRMLTRYNAWANEQIYEGVKALPDGEATKPRNPSERNHSFKSIVHTLNHNYVIASIWQAHLEGRPHGFSARNTEDYPPLEQLSDAQKAIDGWYISYSDQLSNATVGNDVHFTLIGGNKGVMTREQILLHIVNHSTYHRGYVADMLFQIPVGPPMMDLPVFFRERSQA